MKWILVFLLINGFLTDGKIHKQENLNKKGPNFSKRFEKMKIPIHQGKFFENEYYFMLDTTKYPTPLPDDQTHSDVAFDGTNYFVVWQDWNIYTHNEIRGTRVDTMGNVIDYGGEWLSNVMGFASTTPGVSFGDSVFLVVFGDIREPYWDFDLYGVRVKSDGTVLDTNGFTIVSKYNNEGSARVSFDGTNFLVVFSEYDYNANHSDVWGVRVGQDGTILDPDGFPIQTGIYDSKQPDIAFDGTNYLTVWKDYRAGFFPYVYGTRISTDGAVIDSGGFPISAWETGWGWPSITFGGSNYFVAWRDTSFDVVGTRVTPGGQVLDIPPINISPLSIDYTVEPKVTFDGQNYSVFWIEPNINDKLYLTRVSLSGVVLDPTPIQVATIPEGVSWIYSNASSCPTNSFVVWTDNTGTSNDIYGARVDTSGTVLEPDGFPVSVSNNYQEFPALSYDNQNYFSCWSEFRDGLWNIYGIRTDSAGNRIDTNAFVISPRNWTQYWNRVSFLDSIYLVVWHAQPNTWDVHGARVTRSGVVLDPYGIAIGAWAGNQGYPSVAAGDSNFFTVWDDDRNDDGDIYGAIVTLDGQNITPIGIPISTAQYAQWFPDISFDGTNYLVVWEDFRSMNLNWGWIYGSRVSQDGAVLDEILINGNVSTIPRIAFSGNQYLVVWMDIRGYDNYNIYGARVRPDGTVLDPNGFPICTDLSDQAYPDVVFDGEKYIVLWEDYRNGNPDIYEATIDTSGNIDTTIIIAQNAVSEFLPALTKGPSNKVFFNYTAYSNDFKANRTYGCLYPETGVKEKAEQKPNRVSVKISPNPFYTSFELSYSLPHKSKISLKLYDLSGRFVKTIFSGTQSRGTHSINPDLRIPPGVYFLRLKTTNQESNYKLIKIKK